MFAVLFVFAGFTVMAFCEGRLASGTPTWLVGCHTLSLAGLLLLQTFVQNIYNHI